DPSAGLAVAATAGLPSNVPGAAAAGDAVAMPTAAVPATAPAATAAPLVSSARRLVGASRTEPVASAVGSTAPAGPRAAARRSGRRGCSPAAGARGGAPRRHSEASSVAARPGAESEAGRPFVVIDVLPGSVRGGPRDRDRLQARRPPRSPRAPRTVPTRG